MKNIVVDFNSINTEYIVINAFQVFPKVVDSKAATGMTSLMAIRAMTSLMVVTVTILSMVVRMPIF